ncbi:hypothetical protein AusDCA_3770 [Desulfitobacterium sp. AusDCA]
MLTLSELKDNDEIIEVGDIMFVIDRNLRKKIKSIKVDYKRTFRERGFVIDTTFA